jgi:hypothetical protein
MRPEQFLSALEKWEDRIRHLYLDTAKKGGVPTPNVTIGIGCLLPSLAAAQALPFMLSSGNPGEAVRPATLDEIQADWNRVRAMKPGFLAAHYQGHAAQLYLDDDAIDELALVRLEEDCLPGLRRLFQGFDMLPDGVQYGCVDMDWNMGLGTLHTFVDFRAAIDRRDFKTAARESHRAGVRAERNDWCRDQIEGGATA